MILNSFAIAAESTPAYSFTWFDWFCLRYPPGWLILFNRHWQHYHDDPEGWNFVEYLLFLVPGGFYLALFLRWLRLGCRPPRSRGTQIDPQYQAAFRTEILAPILKHHFRAELIYPERIPATGSFMVVMNHAGMCFPWDFVGLGWLLGEETKNNRLVQPLAHPIFFDHAWMRWWLPAGWSQVLGGVRANPQAFEAAIATQEPPKFLLYAPEGWRGLAKGWLQRYQLARFDPSFIRLSDRYQTPILPVICQGNEGLHPWALNIRRLAQWFKLPMFPLSPLLLVFVLFPSMGVWALPSRLRYVVQPLYYPGKENDSAKDSTVDLQNRSVAYTQAQNLRSRLQTQINTLLGRTETTTRTGAKAIRVRDSETTFN